MVDAKLENHSTGSVKHVAMQFLDLIDSNKDGQIDNLELQAYEKAAYEAVLQELLQYQEPLKKFEEVYGNASYPTLDTNNDSFLDHAEILHLFTSERNMLPSPLLSHIPTVLERLSS